MTSTATEEEHLKALEEVVKNEFEGKETNLATKLAPLYELLGLKVNFGSGELPRRGIQDVAYFICPF